MLYTKLSFAIAIIKFCIFGRNRKKSRRKREQEKEKNKNPGPEANRVISPDPENKRTDAF